MLELPCWPLLEQTLQTTSTHIWAETEIKHSCLQNVFLQKCSKFFSKKPPSHPTDILCWVRSSPPAVAQPMPGTGGTFCSSSSSWEPDLPLLPTATAPTCHSWGQSSKSPYTLHFGSWLREIIQKSALLREPSSCAAPATDWEQNWAKSFRGRKIKPAAAGWLDVNSFQHLKELEEKWRETICKSLEWEDKAPNWK